MDQPNTLTKHRQCMREVDYQIRSNRPFIYIVSQEERRVLDSISKICDRGDRKWTLLTWDISEGVQTRTAYDLPKQVKMDQSKVLQWFADEAEPEIEKDTYTILVLKDFQKFCGMDGPCDQVERRVIRQLFNLCENNVGKRKVIIITGTSLFLPPELDKIATVIDWPLPEREHIADKLAQQLDTAKKNPKLNKVFRTDYSTTEMDEIISAFQGMTLAEISFICTYTMLKESELIPASIAKEKQKIIRKSGFLEWIDVKQGMSSVGGLHGFKDWLTKRRNAFSAEAQEYGLPANPKGVLLIGSQGCGKSLSAQAIADFWQLPLLRLDMGKVFGEYVGRSERNLRSMIQFAEAVAPCVLWTDELEKGMAGIGGSGKSDGGVTARVMGSMLTWMQEKRSPVYVVATANDVTALPPELLRKGRFDEIFFVDLPSVEDRKEIFRIHFNTLQRDPSIFDIDRLAVESNDFSGAEIEAAIISALYDSFHDNKRELNTRDVLQSIKSTVPLAITMQEKMTALREWASTRARNASTPSQNNFLEAVPKPPKTHDNIVKVDAPPLPGDEEL